LESQQTGYLDEGPKGTKAGPADLAREGEETDLRERDWERRSQSADRYQSVMDYRAQTVRSCEYQKVLLNS
jgi:hypothetical protein